jgi:hypothetical protein
MTADPESISPFWVLMQAIALWLVARWWARRPQGRGPVVKGSPVFIPPAETNGGDVIRAIKRGTKDVSGKAAEGTTR